MKKFNIELQGEYNYNIDEIAIIDGIIADIKNRKQISIKIQDINLDGESIFRLKGIKTIIIEHINSIEFFEELKQKLVDENKKLKEQIVLEFTNGEL